MTTIQVERWEAIGSDELFFTADDARAVGVPRRRVVDVPAVFRVWDPAAGEWIGGSYPDAAAAATVRAKHRGSEVRIVPADTSPPV